MLSDKVLIVTGAGAGIGEAAARLFAGMGAKVVLGDLDPTSAEEVAQSIVATGGHAAAIATDVRKERDVERLVEFAVETFGRLDGAFNNAGVSGGVGEMTDLGLPDWDDPFEVDMRGVWLCMKYEIRAMLKTGGGAIVNNASNAGLAAVPMMMPYAASKAGAISITKTAAVEFGDRNIRVNAVCPGPIATPRMQAGVHRPPADVAEKMRKFPIQIPLGRPGTPEEVAHLAAFLLSSRASYLTGVAIPIDGGMQAVQ